MPLVQSWGRFVGNEIRSKTNRLAQGLHWVAQIHKMAFTPTFQRLLSLIDPPAQQHFITANGIRTSYLEAGDGPVLVLPSLMQPYLVLLILKWAVPYLTC